jgi:hypothetical protein
MTGPAHRVGIDLARDLALLGAASALTTPAEIVVPADQAWPVEREAWQALGGRIAHFEGAGGPDRAAFLASLGLSRLDYWLVMLALAAEIHTDTAAALSILAEEERIQLPTPVTFARLMHAAACAPYLEALELAAGGGRAARLGLVEEVEPVPGRPITHRGLRIRAAELAPLIAGAQAAGPTLDLAIERERPGEAPVYPRVMVAGAASLLGETGLLWLRAPNARAARQFALDLAGARGEDATFLPVPEELPPPGELARLGGSLLAVDFFAAGGRTPPHGWIARCAAALPALLVLAPERAESSAMTALSVPRIGPREAERVWRTVALPAEERKSLTARFHLNALELRRAIDEAETDARVTSKGTNGSGPTTRNAETISKAVRAQGARRMGRQVTLIECTATLDRLVASAQLKAQLRDVIAWRKATQTVFHEMGLDRDAATGRGLTCLFSGPPGTGKTFAAQCLSSALDLNLYRIDLSQVVSKYIGETEKALAQIFDEAEAGHGVLLFDEADTLFGKRSEVKDAHDRYANIEVGYLLQRMETYDGVLILATNLRNNIDGAFMRRIQFLLDFRMPDVAMRARLWEQALPGKSYRDSSLDVAPFTERFRLSGGSIRNIAVAAAHLAAATPEVRIKPAHLARATFRELEKNGQARSRADFGPLAEHLPEETWAGLSQ